jgi:MerR family transcriptional regulator, light-induced transcriptional regulator
MTISSDFLTLQAAADALGVHYMTVYRYVRLGHLPARKSGGTWHVSTADLLAFQARPALVGGVRTAAPWAERLEHRLVAGDATGAWGVIEAALSGGSEIDEIYLDVIAPALVSIGERWAEGELDVFIEHRASVIVARLIGRLGHRFIRRGRSKGSVVLCTPPGEMHSLSVAMAADLVRRNGWEVSDLGADVPVPSIVRAAQEVDDLVAVGFGVTMESALPSLVEAIAAVRHGAARNVTLIVGGLAIRDSDHAIDVGADRYASNGRDLATVIDGLLTREGDVPAS